jgi:hypothetical protein
VGGLPEGVRKLAENMQRCELRVGILHEVSRAVVEPYLTAANVGIFSNERAHVGSAPSHAEIVDLFETANEMEDETSAVSHFLASLPCFFCLLICNSFGHII